MCEGVVGVPEEENAVFELVGWDKEDGKDEGEREERENGREGEDGREIEGERDGSRHFDAISSSIVQLAEAIRRERVF